MKYELLGTEIVSDFGANLLRRRGISNVEFFLQPQPCCLQSWRDLSNIQVGIELIEESIMDNEPYALVVDSDCDGICSSAIIYQYLKLLNPKKEIDFFLHEGKQHGLEDTWEIIQNKNKDYSIIICPDSATNDSQYAFQFDCPVLVLDHHPF